MANIIKTSVGGAGTRPVTEIVLTATNDLTYEPGAGHVLILRNPTAASIDCVLRGADSTTVNFPGAPFISVAGGYSTPVPAGAVRAIPLDTVAAYLKGPVTVTGAGLVAVLMRAVNGRGARSIFNDPPAAVPGDIPAADPAIVTSPVITGSAVAGGTLSSTLGAASGNPAPNATRQWLADGVAIAGATGATLDTTGRAGQSISLRVTWSNGIGSPAVATSNAITIVAAATAPVPFAAGDWSLATGLEANQLVVNIASLPANGGSPITAIQYSANGGTWTALPGGAGTGPRTLTMPAAATSYSIRLRAVNAVGNSTPGDTKTATSGAADTSAQRVIVLTDYAGDCDDAAAMAIVARAHEEGDINLLGVVTTSTVSTSAPGLRGNLDAYRLQSIPVYAYQGAVGTYNDRYSIQMRDEFGVPGQTRTAYQDDVAGLRTMLAAAPSASVKLIDIGAPISTARLLASPADGISPLTGAELVAAKVVGLWAMAGNFPTGVSEYNMNRDVASSQAVYSSWPTPIYAHGGEVGATIFTGPAPSTVYGDDPVKTAFDAFQNIYGGTLQSGRRQSWDPATVHHAIYGNQALYTLSAAGTIAIDGTGVSTWTVNASGNRFYVTKTASDAAIAAAMQALIDDYAVIAPPGPSNAVNRFFDLNEGNGSPTQRGGTLAMTRASGATWRTDPVGIAHSGTTSHMILPGAGLNADDLLIGAVFRLDRITGTQALAALRVGVTNQYQFRANAAALEAVVFTGNANTATILASPSLLVIGDWAMAVVRMGDMATTLRLNGVEVASASHPVRNKATPDAGVAIAGRYTGSAYTDLLDGDMIGFGYATNAALTDIAGFEAELRAIALAKGITLS
ncbi:hypothetical protein [Paracoccus marcusii]|uniref:Fibronectin type-III domain-containing protein n=1 Tax=Paracoccus marcusii TaxID=59779 RepID=A0ABY7UPZ5_9RHOB|nr:hypothetical protein [Paracoccus marcusii]WDA11678.1 hypothetical protein PRL19_10250 [Paracoccus marcusii]